MNKIVWKDHLSVGDSKMDMQHKMIIKVINSLVDHQDADSHSEYISDLLSTMTQYALQHLKDEEELLKKVNYPDYEKHKTMHAEYRLKVVDFCTATSKNKSITTEILEYLTQWWSHHICIDDQAYKTYLQSQTAGSELNKI